MEKGNYDELNRDFERWENETLRDNLRNFPERKRKFQTISSEPVNRIYSPLDLLNNDYLGDIGWPGEFPFTRGIHSSMHRSRLWTMRMFAGFGTAEETNKDLNFYWTKVKPVYRLHLICQR